MHKYFLLYGALALGSLGLALPAKSQTGNVAAAPAATTTDADAAAKKAGVTTGVPLPVGLGFFANPDNYHRLTVGIQAGLGVGAESETFGYDNLAVSSKWKLGTNTLGRHLSALVGFSDWRVPAYRKVFPTAQIDPLPNQDRFGAQSANAAALGMAFSDGRGPWMADSTQKQALAALDGLIDPYSAGLPTYLLNSPAYQVGKDYTIYRTPVEDEQAQLLQVQESALQRVDVTASLFVPVTLSDADKATLKSALQMAGKDAATIDADIAKWQKGKITKEEVNFLLSLHIGPQLLNQLAYARTSPTVRRLWKQQQTDLLISYQKGAVRERAYSLGVLSRFASFAEETKLQAFDAYGTIAKGNTSYDFVAAAHYLHYLDNSLPRYAATLAAGVYADLNDTEIFPVLGLTVGYGYYAFRELHDVIPEAAMLADNQNPSTRRLDIVLSISGAPDKTSGNGAGFGFRYSYISPSLLPAYNAASLVFSTNFSLVK